MKTEMKSILFANTRKFVIEEGSLSEPSNVLMAMTLNRNLEKYGYSLDASALRALSTQTPSEMQKTWDELVTAVREVSGARQFSNRELFYPNFPEEVMRANDAHMYINSLFYYTFAQSNNVMMEAIAEELREALVGTKQERLPLIEQFPRELKVINKGTEKDLLDMMNARIHSLNMSEQNFVELRAFAREYHKEFDKMISSDEPFQSKETKVRIAMMLHEEKRDREISMMLKDSVDVLRYAAMLSYKNGIYWNNVTLAPHDGHDIAFKLTNSEQKQIKGLLCNCKNLYTDIWRQEDLFKRLMNRIKPTQDGGCPARVIKAFDNLAKNRHLDEHGEPIFNFENERKKAVQTLNQTGNDRHLCSLAEHFPGAFLKSYTTTVRDTNEAYREKAVDAIKHCAGSTAIALRDILTTQKAVTAAQDRDEALARGEQVVTVYTHHGGKHFVRVYDEPNMRALDAQTFSDMRAALHETAAEMVRGYQNLGNVYIDPALSNRKAPGREMRDASGGAIVVPHSIIPGDKNKNLMILGINWGQVPGNHDTHVDVDASVHFYGPDYEERGNVSYSNLRHPAAVHSGDYTHVPMGGTSTEAIVIDKERLKQHGIRYAVAEVHCYSVKSFKEAGNCHFVMQQREGSFNNVEKNLPPLSTHDRYYRSSYYENERFASQVACRSDAHDGGIVFMGETFEPAASECNILLNSDASMTAPFVYDVETDKVYWLDYSISHEYHALRPSTTNDPTKMAGVIVEIEAATHSKKPDMEQLFRTFAEHNGTIVEDISQAQTVFVADTVDAEKLNIQEGARIITSYDLDIISKEFSGNNDLSKEQEQKTPEQPIQEEPKVKQEPALVKQLRFFNAQMAKYPYPIRESRGIDIDIDRHL